MSEYKDLQAQIADLQKQAEAARKSELANVISGIKAQIKEHGLTASDLGLKGGAKSAKASNPVDPIYRDPKSGKTWTGRGKRPTWIADVFNTPKVNAFLISAQDEKAAEKSAAKKVVEKKPAAKKAVAKKVATKKPAAKKPSATSDAPAA